MRGRLLIHLCKALVKCPKAVLSFIIIFTGVSVMIMLNQQRTFKLQLLARAVSVYWEAMRTFIISYCLPVERLAQLGWRQWGLLGTMVEILNIFKGI